MNARDELAGIIGASDGFNPDDFTEHDWDDYRVNADAILSAGYTKPRTIATAEELDELPGEVLVLTEQGGYWESVKRMDGLNWWKEPGSPNVVRSEDLTLPATVLYEPPA